MIATLASAPDDLQILKLYLIDFTGLGKRCAACACGAGCFYSGSLVWRWRGRLVAGLACGIYAGGWGRMAGYPRR